MNERNPSLTWSTAPMDSAGHGSGACRSPPQNPQSPPVFLRKRFLADTDATQQENMLKQTTKRHHHRVRQQSNNMADTDAVQSPPRAHRVRQEGTRKLTIKQQYPQSPPRISFLGTVANTGDGIGSSRGFSPPYTYGNRQKTPINLSAPKRTSTTSNGQRSAAAENEE